MTIHSPIANPQTSLRAFSLRLAAGIAIVALFAIVTPEPGLARLYLVTQDSYVIAGLIGLLLATGLSRSSTAPALPKVRLRTRYVILASGLIALALWAGTYLLMADYPLTRDEHMVLFDMAVFRSGRLAVPLAPEWRPFVNALTPAFLLPLPGNAAWVSGYMPVNAMLRTGFSMLLDPALMNPLLAAVGLLALFDVARRIFPDDRGAQLVALLLYVTSAQVLVTAMTTYAMTGHLALNLLWLALFMRGTKASHAGAIAVGFLAVGLHQIVFHPLFALPFLAHLRRRGEWRTAMVYVIAYAAILLFWISYPHLIAWSAGIAASQGAGSGSAGFIAERVVPLLTNRDPLTLPLTAANLIRFVTWQNLAMLPLAFLGARAIRSDDSIARPLAWGVMLTIVAMTVLLPYQGHGWGYRYLHGLIGSCALLAAFGWRDFSSNPKVRSFVIAASTATLFVSLPFLLWQAHAFVGPYARVNQMIEGINAEMVVVETEGPSFAIDEARNLPDLSNRPIRLSGKALKAADVPTLCARGSIAFVPVERMQALGLGIHAGPTSRHFQALVHAANVPACHVISV